MKSLSWDAVRDGDRYCAPACGGGCTWEAYAAVKVAAETAARSMGPGWSADISENLGWRWKIVKGPMTVSMWSEDWTATLKNYLGRGSTPAEAVRDVRSQARAHIKEIEELLK